MPRIACFTLLTVSLLSHTAATATEDPLVAPRPLAYWVGRLTHSSPAIRRRAGSEVEFYALDCFSPRGQFDPASIKRYSAFREEVKPLLPQLIRVLKDSYGASTVGVSHCNPVDAACLLIAVLGTDAKSALPELKRLVRDKNTNLLSRDACFYAILHLTPETQPVGPLYIECLDASSTDPAHGEEEPNVPYPDFSGRISSFNDPLPHPFYSSVLLATGHTKCEVPFLVQVAEGEYKLADRVTAIEILGQFGFDGKAAVSALRRLLKDKDKVIRLWAARSLFQIEDDPKRGVPYLLQVAEGNYAPKIRAGVIVLLGELESDATVAVPALRRLLNDNDKSVRSWVAQSLIAIEQDEKHIPEIVNALNLDRQKSTKFETGMKEFLSDLKAQRDERRETIAEYDFDEESLDGFITMMDYGSGYFRRLAIQTLGDIGPRAKSIIPELRKALNDPDEDTRRMAREALQRIQP